MECGGRTREISFVVAGMYDVSAMFARKFPTVRRHSGYAGYTWKKIIYRQYRLVTLGVVKESEGIRGNRVVLEPVALILDMHRKYSSESLTAFARTVPTIRQPLNTGMLDMEEDHLQTLSSVEVLSPSRCKSSTSELSVRRP
jgi:hypothetical protein